MSFTLILTSTSPPEIGQIRLVKSSVGSNKGDKIKLGKPDLSYMFDGISLIKSNIR